MNNQQNNNNKNQQNNNNNFFNNNPLLVFVLFSLVTIFAFKALFPEDQVSNGNNAHAFGSSSHKTVSYSELKKLISSGSIEYVGIGYWKPLPFASPSIITSINALFTISISF